MDLESPLVLTLIRFNPFLPRNVFWILGLSLWLNVPFIPEPPPPRFSGMDLENKVCLLHAGREVFEPLLCLSKHKSE